MNAAFIHIALNHVPVMATFFAAGFGFGGLLLEKPLWLAFARRLILIAAIFSVPTFLSGARAESRVEHVAGVDSTLIDAHEESGEFALQAALGLGAITLVTFWCERRRGAVPRWLTLTFVGGALILSAIFARTAHLGGMIHHPEIRADATPPS